MNSETDKASHASS